MSQIAVQVSNENNSPILRKLTVEVPAERVNNTRLLVVKEFRKQVKVPGFRPGTAPDQVILTKFRDDISRHLTERLIRDSIDEALKQVDSKVLNVQHIHPEPFTEKNSTFRYEATVEVPPSFKLKNYKKISVQQPSQTVTQQDIDDVLDNLRKNQATFVTAPIDAVVAETDKLMINYVAKQGEQIYPDGDVKNFEVILGQNRMHPQFEAALIGAKLNTPVHFSIHFSQDDAPTEQLKNQTLNFTAEVLSIEKQVLPQWSDELAAKIMKDATLATLTERIKTDLVAAAQQQAERAVENQVIETLLEEHDFIVPPGVVNQRRQEIAEDAARRLLYQGYPEASVKKMVPMLLADSADQAVRDVRVGFILDAIAHEEKLQVTDNEVEQELEEAAKAEGQAGPALIARAKSEGWFERIRGQLKNRQALKFLREHANIKEVSKEDYAAYVKKRQEKQAKEEKAKDKKAKA